MENIKIRFIKFIKIIKKMEYDKIDAYSAECAYYTILSFIPFLILLMTTIKYTKIEPQILIEYISKIVPISMNNVVIDIYPDKYYHDVLNTLNEFLTPFTIENEQGEVFETGENRLYAPTLIAYKKGKAVALDECISDKQTDPYQKLTKSMKKEMKEKADKLFKEYNK